MSFSQTLIALSHDVLRHAKAYPAGRSRHPELASLATPQDVVRRLASSSSATPQERNQIVVALLEEHRAGTCPLWQAILFASSTPMLLRLRKRLKRDKDEDVDQRLLTAFVSALRVVRMGPYAAISLRWATEKEVFLDDHKERRQVSFELFEEETHPADVFGVDVRDQERAREILAMLEARGEELVEVVLATHVGDESLEELAARKCPGADKRTLEREVIRLARARQHVVQRIRTSLMPKAA